MSETIVKKGTANLWYGIHSVKGKLFLTATRLIHEPGMMQVKKTRTEIMLEDVEKVRPVNNMFGKIPIPNGLRVTTAQGEEYQFVVNRRKDWAKKVEEAMGALSREAAGK
ncbi:GRAM domain-containing protein [Lacicoccus alkaliphilus]|uniref:GRAM domain-containing protein n=1 Tax=Lacicoccus alkaliphilus DSM 16010 TaxID=1123231 RepID=A0A1M7FFU6_9BACL|nr:GRAM domain-containing protein [Salinicoccus alkaliphilus]SHM02876.1 hypothetical protein SAMN02745189_01440 [Salinicoccus alkaliphilus DSM 16010]